MAQTGLKWGRRAPDQRCVELVERHELELNTQMDAQARHIPCAACLREVIRTREPEISGGERYVSFGSGAAGT